MNNNEFSLCRMLVENKFKEAQSYARSLLLNDTSKQTQVQSKALLERMKKNIEIPYNLESCLTLRLPEEFCTENYLEKKLDQPVVTQTEKMYRTAESLEELGIRYPTSLLLYGESGTGKTELAQYIACQMELPFLLVRFSGLMDSKLGQTAQNLNHIFSFAIRSPCVLCFDEIDAVGIKRGMTQEVGEMSRITISLMQELDALPSNILFIGTTNRIEELDPALFRRFQAKHEVLAMSKEESDTLAKHILARLPSTAEEGLSKWNECAEEALKQRRFFAKPATLTPAFVVNTCAQIMADSLYADPAQPRAQKLTKVNKGAEIY